MKSPVSAWRKQKTVRNSLGMYGEIISWTTISVAPPRFSYLTPYVVVLVQLQDNRKVYGQLVDVEQKDVKIGQKVTSILRKTAQATAEEVVEYGLKFELTD
ncbi:MAG: Zn-ribbon domain-containing OB-fold protein [Weeksellaceae bacterium]